VLIVHGPDGAPVREIPTDGLRRALDDISDVRSASVSVRVPSLDDVFFALTGTTAIPTKENA
jgi:hypothetical protein